MRRAARVSRWLAVPVACLAVGLGGPSAAAGVESEYVALGDSYTAGPLIPDQTGRPLGCARSNRDYPALVAQRLGSPRFRDVSCSGASTVDIAAPQRVAGGPNPPQLDALSEGTDLVTLGIGGNDIGFLSIVATCTARSATNPFGAACRDFYTTGGRDRLAERIAATAPKVAAALAEIHRRAPAARVLLVGYPAILPDSGPGCFPLLPFSPGDVAYLRETEKRLNAMLAARAARGGAEFVDTYTPSIGHDACRLPGVKWVEGLVPTAPAAPLHPNSLGMQASARAVLSQLGSLS